jgi:hypothetical protein
MVAFTQELTGQGRDLGKSLSDYIKVYEHTLSPERCQALIERFEAAPGLHERKSAEGSCSFVQLSVSRHWKDVEVSLVSAR